MSLTRGLGPRSGGVRGCLRSALRAPSGGAFADSAAVGLRGLPRPFPPGPPWVRAGAECPRLRWWPAVAFGAAAASRGATGRSRALPALLLAVVLGTLLAVIDLGCLRLPDPLVGGVGGACRAAAAPCWRPERVGRACSRRAVCWSRTWWLPAARRRPGPRRREARRGAGLVLGFTAGRRSSPGWSCRI